MAASTPRKTPVATGEQDPFLTMLKISFPSLSSLEYWDTIKLRKKVCLRVITNGIALGLQIYLKVFRDLNTSFKLHLWASELVVKMRLFRTTDKNWSLCHSLLLLQWKYSMLMRDSLEGSRWFNGYGTRPQFAGLPLIFALSFLIQPLCSVEHAKFSGRCPRCAKKQHNFQFISSQNISNFQRC